jgi:hypothetical protein
MYQALSGLDVLKSCHDILVKLIVLDIIMLKKRFKMSAMQNHTLMEFEKSTSDGHP